MATLYELTNQYKMLQHFIEENDAEGFELALSQIEGEVASKLEGYAMVIKNIESDIAGIKAEEKRLAERRKTMESNVDRMKQAMQDALLTVEGNRLKTDKFTFYFLKSKAVRIEDETLIPPQFIKTKSEVIKTDIAKLLKEGAQIPGARLVENQSLQIK